MLISAGWAWMQPVRYHCTNFCNNKHRRHCLALEILACLRVCFPGKTAWLGRRPLVSDFRDLGLGSMLGGNLAWEATKKPLISLNMLRYEHIECVLIFDGLWHSYLGDHYIMQATCGSSKQETLASIKWKQFSFCHFSVDLYNNRWDLLPYAIDILSGILAYWLSLCWSRHLWSLSLLHYSVWVSSFPSLIEGQSSCDLCFKKL
jgi:hypothetical protein